MRFLHRNIEEFLNNLKIKNKLQVLFICCVLLPLVLTDSVIIYTVLDSSAKNRHHDSENIASAINYSLSNTAANVDAIAKRIYTNKVIDNFLEKDYDSVYDYVVAYHSFEKNTLFKTLADENVTFNMYADNETIVNGGLFCRISTIERSDWYQYLMNSGKNQVLYTYYDRGYSPVENRRRFVFIKKLDYFHTSKPKILRMELNYSLLVQNLVELNFDSPVYVCHDGKILLSNWGNNSISRDYEEFSMASQVGTALDMDIGGYSMQIYVLEPNPTIFNDWIGNLPLIVSLIMISIILPLIFMRELNHSFVTRLQKLSTVFGGMTEDKLEEIPDVRGKDEIGSLMRNYNRMAARMNQLIQIVYKNKLKEQEMDIARQNAELLALHSQINPHFLFNALESIRMHSILKNEEETANMVEKLALMQRQYVEWGNDFVTVEQEMEFVKAYLGLQKYRFGDRLSYEIDVEEQLSHVKIPKLTVVTFVENACVHGIESKLTPGWVFVRAYQEKETLCLEIEDTGGGMEDSYRLELIKKMKDANIELLKEKGRVGVINACLRLKMLTKNQVDFELDGEEGTGTMVLIRIPLNYVR